MGTIPTMKFIATLLSFAAFVHASNEPEPECVVCKMVKPGYTPVHTYLVDQPGSLLPPQLSEWKVNFTPNADIGKGIYLHNKATCIHEYCESLRQGHQITGMFAGKFGESLAENTKPRFAQAVRFVQDHLIWCLRNPQPIGPIPEVTKPASPKAAAGGSDNEAVPEAEQVHLPKTPPNSPADVEAENLTMYIDESDDVPISGHARRRLIQQAERLFGDALQA